MDARVRKLAHVLGDGELAEKLVKARLDTPRKIKAAEDGAITAIPGVGKSTLDKIRARVPRRES